LGRATNEKLPQKLKIAGRALQAATLVGAQAVQEIDHPGSELLRIR